MKASDFQTSPVFHELLDEVRGLEAKLFEGPNALTDEQSVLEGYKWIFSITPGRVRRVHVGRPRQASLRRHRRPVQEVGRRQRRRLLQVRPDRSGAARTGCGASAATRCTSRSRSTAGPTTAATRSASSAPLNDRAPRHRARRDASSSCSAPTSTTGSWIKLEPDAVVAITRDYLVDPVTGRRVRVAHRGGRPAGDVPGGRRPTSPAAFRAAAHLGARAGEDRRRSRSGEPNSVDEPYPVPEVTYGWAAGDAAYAMGSFDLGDGEMLVIEGRSPECAFWNMCLWNQFLHTYNYEYERVTINGGQVGTSPTARGASSSPPRDPGHPNWVSTAGHPRGRIWFRWFYPSATPERPTTRVELTP